MIHILSNNQIRVKQNNQQETHSENPPSTTNTSRRNNAHIRNMQTMFAC